MAHPEILIAISGMGDPEAGATDDWATALFPGCSLVDTGAEKRIEIGGRTIHLLEVLYEDSNEAVRQKFEALSQIVPAAAPDALKDTIEDYALDVVENVLLASALEPAQLRFVETYNKALDKARALVGEEGNVRQTKIGVISHSLGTLIAYEGICRAFDTELLTSIVDVNVVMCAPMLSPIYEAMHAVGVDRYLADNGCNKPYQRSASGRRYSIIRKCMGLYDTRDPFWLIQAKEFYKKRPTNDLMDAFVTYESATPLTRFWEGHSMLGSYVATKGSEIAEWLFSS
jgi:hypothetical protein